MGLRIPREAGKVLVNFANSNFSRSALLHGAGYLDNVCNYVILFNN
jgi:hypothetical protein